jgi:aspartate aminotransferase-like enzyme
MMLPDEYMRRVADAVHEVGGLFVLDCVASGCMWVDMNAVGVDVLISAPQKGWSAAPGIGIVMLSPLARSRLDETRNTVYSLDLQKWVYVMEAYERGTHRVATLPTDAIVKLHDISNEMAEYGFERIREQQIELGNSVRRLLCLKGFKSVAAPGYGAPGVVVSYTHNQQLKTGAKFAALGMQISAGVPLMLDDFTSSKDFRTFRLGLFGIDKLTSMSDTVKCLERVLRLLPTEFMLLVSNL